MFQAPHEPKFGTRKRTKNRIGVNFFKNKTLCKSFNYEKSNRDIGLIIIKSRIGIFLKKNLTGKGWIWEGRNAKSGSYLGFGRNCIKDGVLSKHASPPQDTLSCTCGKTEKRPRCPLNILNLCFLDIR